MMAQPAWRDEGVGNNPLDLAIDQKLGTTVREPGELRRLALSFSYFALLLASYYLIRPVRDALAAGGGADTIKYLSAAVFVTMLAIVPVYGFLLARIRRSLLLPLTYGFFAANLLCFAFLFHLDGENVWTGRVFYVWTTVFNLFVVSVFWSFMADIWREAEGRRLFGVIASGGSLGGLLGPIAARQLVFTIGTAGLALLAALLLAGTIVIALLLMRDARGREAGEGGPREGARSLDEPMGGEILAGLSHLAASPFLLGIAVLVALGSLLGMIVYIELAKAAATHFASAAERTNFFSVRDLWVNGASFFLQLAAVGPLAHRLGVRPILVGAGLLAALAFAGLGLMPTMGLLVIVNIVLRTTEFGFAKPSRDMLWTVVDPQSKYKVKNVVDTVVARGSDVVSGWIHAGMTAAGLSLTGFAVVGVGIGLVIAFVGLAEGTGYRRRGGQ
jgi:AAA family ATP:ADP antiporter